MAAELDVRRFESEDLDAASRLLAARHRLDRQSHPILPARFEDPIAVREELKETMSFARGVSAFRDRRLIGFIFGIRLLPAPPSTFARFAPERSSMMFAHGHAAAADEDQYAVYHALYGALAQEWVAAGIFDHVAHVPEGEAEAPWHDLGFGRVTAVADRAATPLEAAPPAGVSVREAGAEDIEAVLRIMEDGTSFHARSPIFWPNLSAQTEDAVRRELTQAFADDKQAMLLAREGDLDQGVLWIVPARGSPLFVPDKAAYIGDTAVLESSRRSGVGRALVQAAITWAREHEYENLSLHFATANAVSRAFWTGLGFEPVMYHLRRHIDERIAWAK